MGMTVRIHQTRILTWSHLDESATTARSLLPHHKSSCHVPKQPNRTKVVNASTLSHHFVPNDACSACNEVVLWMMPAPMFLSTEVDKKSTDI